MEEQLGNNSEIMSTTFQSAEEIDYTWYEAREWCMSNGGDLASFHTTDEQTFVTDWVQ